MLLHVLHLYLLLALECAHTLEHLVPINESSVKLRAVDADKLGLATDGETTGTAHTGTIDHDGVERHVGRDIVFLCEQAAELHHDGRTDGKYLVDVLLVDEFLDTDSHDTLFAIRTIVGHDNEFVTAVSHLIFEDDKIFGTTGYNREYTVARSLKCTDDGEHGSHADTTTGTDDSTEFLDMCRIAEWANHVGNVITLIE